MADFRERVLKNGMHWKAHEVSYGALRGKFVEVSGYVSLGCRGRLSAEFLGDELWSLRFFPEDAEAYFRKFAVPLPAGAVPRSDGDFDLTRGGVETTTWLRSGKQRFVVMVDAALMNVISRAIIRSS